MGRSVSSSISAFSSVDLLEDALSEPTEALRHTLASVPGDILVLGAGGKMGPSLAIMARRAAEHNLPKPRRIFAASRFSRPPVEANLKRHGVETIPCDLLDPDALERLPDAPNVIFMAGTKFGSTGAEPHTWATNAHLPGLVCRRFRKSRIVAFSTGNVYPFVPVAAGGSSEDDPAGPVGEYAMSCLGRERVFEHFSTALSIPVAIVRLSYAVEMRYGVLVDLAQRVYRGEPIDLTMGSFVAIWQRDAAAMSLRLLQHAGSPPLVVNITGPETLSVRRVATEFGRLMHRDPVFAGEECGRALISSASRSQLLLGYPETSIAEVIRWTANWILRGCETYGKPTKFETMDGRF
ncbi:MAG TPA: NAD(P)-dependent oxidoreductase [Chthonomonadaceae bacterium]|nr:NAD(P)-dependent oxidoreductase [Chthonomonadaceae bacterium]